MMTRQVERAATRLKTFERTTIVCSGITSVAHVLNLSETGAQVYSAAAMTPGREVHVALAGRDVRGMVVWTNDRKFGVRFLQKLSSDEIESLLK